MSQRESFVKEYDGLHFVIRQPREYKYIPSFPDDKADQVNNFYAKIEEYRNTVTPIIKLKNLAKHIGINSILIKEESIRFNLSSFKAIGGLYTVVKLLCNDILNVKLSSIQSLKHLRRLVQERNLSITIITASDGNHGRGIAWSCNQIGIKCIILMPKGTVKSRVDNIEIYDVAKVIVTNLNYDDTVLYAFKMAKQDKNYYIVQDVAIDNYYDIPLDIMHGYAQIARECIDELQDKWPTHIILQVGVGAFASSITAYFINKYIKNKNKYKMPKIITIEPMNAAPAYKTAKYNNNNDDKLQFVSGELESIMAGLACGVLTEIGGQILNKYVNVYCRANDFISKDSIRILSNPLGNDKKIFCGESGGVGVGLLYHIMMNKQYKEIKNKINLNENSRVLIINTEGITDPVNNKIITSQKFNYFSTKTSKL